MNPLERSERLSAYLDDDLEASERVEVQRWLEASAEARAELDALRGLRTELRATEAVDQLWSRVQISLDAANVSEANRIEVAGLPADSPTNLAPTSLLPRRAVVAATVALAAALALVLVWPRADKGVDELAQARAAYVRALHKLERKAEPKIAELPPELRQRMQDSLRIVDLAVRDAEHVLEDAPKDRFVHDTLLTLYAEKTRVLEAVVGTETPSRGDTP